MQVMYRLSYKWSPIKAGFTLLVAVENSSNPSEAFGIILLICLQTSSKNVAADLNS